VNGRKRHILVDTLGLIIAVVVIAANTDDRRGMLLRIYFVKAVKRLHKIGIDGGIVNAHSHSDYEGLTANREAMIQISMSRILPKRLAQ
jgi:transposase